MVVRVHSLGADRKQELFWRQKIASQGYAVWSYDVRGHVSASGAGQTMWRGQESFDLAEQLAFVRHTWRGVVSADHIAVIGRSQGGVHAWGAAADSDTLLEVDGRGQIHMPRIAAVVAGDFVADPAQQRLRDGTAFSSFSLEVAAPGAPRSFALDPLYQQAFRRAFLAQDPQSLSAALHRDHGKRRIDALASTSVPVLYFHAYRDMLCSPALGLRALRGLPGTTPWRALLTSVGHGTPQNQYEDAKRREETLRWLSHFLWFEENGVLEDAQVVCTRLPLDVRRLDPSTLLGHEHHADTGHRPYRDLVLLLGSESSQSLDYQGPSESEDLIAQTISSQYTAQRYFDNPFLRQTSVLLAAIPLAEKVYPLFVTREALQLGKRAIVHLELTPDSSRFSVAVLLSARLPGKSSSVMLASVGQTVLDAIPNKKMSLDLELLPTAAELPVGTALELSVRNLWLREAPMERRIEVAPLFDNFALRVHRGVELRGFQLGSTMTLPVRSPEPELVTPVTSIDTGRPEFVPLVLRATEEQRGATYTLLAGLSGHDMNAAGSPLQFDALTYAVLQMSNAPALRGFIGTLDHEGHADAAFDFGLLPPLPGVLVGRRLSFAACVLSQGPLGSENWSSPVAVQLR